MLSAQKGQSPCGNMAGDVPGLIRSLPAHLGYAQKEVESPEECLKLCYDDTRCEFWAHCPSNATDSKG